MGDRPLLLLRVRAGVMPRAGLHAAVGAGTLEQAAFEIHLEPNTVPVPVEASGRKEDLLLLEYATGEGLLIMGSEVYRIGVEEGVESLVHRICADPVAWRREHSRLRRRTERMERVVAFWDDLAGAATVQDIYRLLAGCAPGIADGYAAMVLAYDAEAAHLRVAGASDRLHRYHDLVVPHGPHFQHLGILRERDAVSGPFPMLAPLFQEMGAFSLLHIPCGEEGVLFLVERRRDRVFESADWDVLRLLAGQTAAAVERVRLRDAVEELSLFDPVTGFATRRHLEVLLGHRLAEAHRGGSLALALVSVDSLDQVVHTQGRSAGDRLLRNLAAGIREVTRTADLVARYAPDQFLIMLPGESSISATALVRRLRHRLAGDVEISVGVSEFSVGTETADLLIEGAIRKVEAARQLRHRSGAPE